MKRPALILLILLLAAAAVTALYARQEPQTVQTMAATDVPSAEPTAAPEPSALPAEATQTELADKAVPAAPEGDRTDLTASPTPEAVG